LNGCSVARIGAQIFRRNMEGRLRRFRRFRFTPWLRRSGNVVRQFVKPLLMCFLRGPDGGLMDVPAQFQLGRPRCRRGGLALQHHPGPRRRQMRHTACRATGLSGDLYGGSICLAFRRIAGLADR
jgi:hypothetical protein